MVVAATAHFTVEDKSSLSASAEYSGTRLEIFKKSLKYTILTFLTFGFYRFAAKTKMRRYLWSNIHIGGEPLEYTGTAMELFKGFLVAIMFLIPLSILSGFVEVWAEAGRPILAEIANFIFAVIIAILIPFALYRLWRYRLSRTLWRGVRFGLDGSALEFVQIAFRYGFLSGISLGIAYPWMKIAMVEYRLNNTRYGDTYFRFDGHGGGVLIPWLIFYGSAVCSFILLVIMAPILFAHTFNADAAETGGMGSSLQFFVPIAVWLILTVMVYGWYRVQFWRYIVSKTSFGSANASSEFDYKTILLPGLALLISLLCAAALVVLIVDQFYGIGDGGLFPTEFGILLFFFAAVLLASLGSSIVYATVFHDILKHACGTLVISDFAPFEQARQNADTGPDRGEGFADALDVGAF